MGPGIEYNVGRVIIHDGYVKDKPHIYDVALLNVSGQYDSSSGISNPISSTGIQFITGSVAEIKLAKFTVSPGSTLRLSKLHTCDE